MQKSRSIEYIAVGTYVYSYSFSKVWAQDFEFIAWLLSHQNLLITINIDGVLIMKEGWHDKITTEAHWKLLN